MAGTKLKTVIVASAAILLVTSFVILSPSGVSGGRLKLPVGQGPPAISLGQTHGLILASDGSLWAWGSDFLGWPVLGLGNLTGQTRLRRVGSDTNWISTPPVILTISPSNRMGHFGLGDKTFMVSLAWGQWANNT